MVKSYAATMAERYPSSIEVPPRPTIGEIADAKRVLERAGYAVIAKDRIRIAMAETTVALRECADFKAPDSLVENMKGYLASQLGEKIVEEGGAGAKDETNYTTGHRRITFSVKVILPEPK